jgi:hypothetical protein
MSSGSEQDPLKPGDSEFQALLGLGERSKSRPSLSQGTRSESIRSQIFLPASLDPELIHEPAGLVREERRAALFSFAARFAAAAVVVTVVALLFVIMTPASRQSDPGLASSEITGTMRTAQPPSGQGDGSKSALAEFRAILAPAPASQTAAQEQSQLQQFLQWRQKANSTETSR